MLSNKGQVATIFLHFEVMVSRKFGVSIKQLQSDGGIELKSLENHLFQGGFVKRISCPYTPLQNRVVKRKSRHFVEISLAMLMRFGVSVPYWDCAFKNSIHLINHCHIEP